MDEIWDLIGSVSEGFLPTLPLNLVLWGLGSVASLHYCIWAVSGRFLLLRNFSGALSVSPHVCFILVLRVGRKTLRN